MKLFSIILFIVTSTFPSYSQTNIRDGDSCFDNGDYVCAVTNYNNAFISATGKDKQIAEIKITRAKWCAEHIKTANQSFSAKNYETAKDEYQKVLDSNPKDSYAQSQIVKCDNALNPPKLRKATTADLTDIWNNKYGVQPKRRENLINVGIDPDDAQARISRGEGKPLETEKKATSLSVSNSSLHFTFSGETIGPINVYSDVDTYSIPSWSIPSWCTIKSYDRYFVITASENPNSTSRNDWFKVTAGEKEVIVTVEQIGRSSANSQKSNKTKEESVPSNINRCFNCPKTHDTWGLNLGYAQQYTDSATLDVTLFGLKVEPLFKYGFGLNTGINVLGYSGNSFEKSFDSYGINVPLHLEYRFNFSKWFNIYGYGGVGFNAITNPEFSNYTLPGTFEYGGGLRVSHVQFNIGRSLYLGNFRYTQNFGKYTEMYQKLNLSVSYMF